MRAKGGGHAERAEVRKAAECVRRDGEAARRMGVARGHQHLQTQVHRKFVSDQLGHEQLRDA